MISQNTKSVGQEGARILVIEDDPSIAMGLRINLHSAGFEVVVVGDGDEGLERAQEGWDLLILDLNLPGLNGFQLLERLRSTGDSTPVIILSARSTELDTIAGLDLGADDYVTKPFRFGELLARIRATLRRQPNEVPETWTFGSIEVDPATREVTRGGAPVPMTVTEFDVLEVLLRSKGRVLTRQQILDAAWGSNHFGSLRTVDNFVAQLRTKLEDDPASPRFLVTVRGVGYRLLV